MKRIISILIVAFVLFAIPAWAIYQSSTFGNRSGIASAGASGGRVGTATDASTTSTEEAPTSNRTFFSTFTPSALGNVSYLFIDIPASLDQQYIRAGIWLDSDGSLVASSTACTATNVVGTVWRYALSASYELTNQNYRLGWGSGDAAYIMEYVSAGSGSIYGDTTSKTANQCPAAMEDPVTANLDYGSIYVFTGTLKIWASNDPNDY